MDFTVEPNADADIAVKLQTDALEVNFRASREELLQLRGIRAASRDDRRSIRAGHSAGAPVFWASDGSEATLMIGHDEETWDVAVTFPLTVVEEIVRKVETEPGSFTT